MQSSLDIGSQDDLRAMPGPGQQMDRAKLVIIMVGLPARGKTFISRSISRYFNWMGVSTETFNNGKYRRELLGASQTHEFFDPKNPKGMAQRRKMARRALEDMLQWLADGGQVGILDATNSTQDRRNWLLKEIFASKLVMPDRVIFVESVCNDPRIIKANVRETKLKSPDYAPYSDPTQAVEDFLARIRHYEEAYQTLNETDDHDKSYIRLIDVGRRIELNNFRGYLPGRLTNLLMNVHVFPRKVWITRHGESVNVTENKIGGDSELTRRGRAYSYALRDFIDQQLQPEDQDSNRKPLIVWCSTMKRAEQTAELLQYPIIFWKVLDELDAGVCDDMTYKEFETQMPKAFKARESDKYRWRFPRGESYSDLVQRLDPAIIELERQTTPILIICHRAVTRVLYAYMKGMRAQDCTNIPIPLHTVIEITPNAYGLVEERHELDIEPFLSKVDEDLFYEKQKS